MTLFTASVHMQEQEGKKNCNYKKKCKNYSSENYVE